jgi:peptide/nickel transport system substrate-binding protein
MRKNPDNDAQRRSAVERIMEMGGNRRDLLKAAFAAGLIPVLSGPARAFAQSDATPVAGGTFYTLGHQDLTTLSPENGGATVVWACLVQLFDCMYQVNENYELEPVLAESHEVSADGLTYTFKLKSGVTFHNGDPLTSADVKYTIEWCKDPANGSTRASNVELVSKVETPDDTTVVITLTSADVTFLVNVAPLLVYPSKYHAEVGEDKFGAAPIGTGPFKLAATSDYSPASFLELKANDAYFRGRPHFDVYRMDIAPEASARFVALESGTADHSMWSLNADDNHSLEESGNFTVYKALSLAVNHIPLNNTHPFLSDKAARKALITALDRQATLEEVYKGDGQLATSNLSPGLGNWYSDQVTQYPYDADAAAKLLDDAGWAAGGDGKREKDGVKAAFTITAISGDTQRRPIAEIAQALWSELGVDVQIAEAQVGDILAKLPKGELDASLFNWTYGGNNADPDARDTLMTGAANNFSQFSNARVDELLDLAVTQQNVDERKASYVEIQQIIAEEVPFVYNLYPQSYAFFNKRIKGLPEAALSSDSLIQKVYLFWKEEA